MAGEGKLITYISELCCSFFGACSFQMSHKDHKWTVSSQSGTFSFSATAVDLDAALSEIKSKAVAVAEARIAEMEKALADARRAL